MNNKLDTAFKIMRQQNLIAKQNFACCVMCATKQLNTISKERKVQPLGAVFYTRKEAEEKAKGNSFQLWYGSFDVDNSKIKSLIRLSLQKAKVDFIENDQSFLIHTNKGD